MKGINKYVNDYICLKTDYCYKAKLTTKLRKNDFCIRDKLIKFNKDLMYKNIHNKEKLKSIMDEALAQMETQNEVL